MKPFAPANNCWPGRRAKGSSGSALGVAVFETQLPNSQPQRAEWIAAYRRWSKQQRA